MARVFRSGDEGHAQRLEKDHRQVLAAQRPDVVDEVGGGVGQPGHQRDEDAAGPAAHRHRDHRCGQQCDSERQHAPREQRLPEDREEQHVEHVKDRRVVRGVEWEGAAVAVGPLALAVQHSIVQLEALALVVVVRPAEEIDGVGDVDGEVGQEGQQRNDHQPAPDPDKHFVVRHRLRS